MDNFERRHNINNNNNNNNINNIKHNAEIMQRGQEDLIRTAFEYTFPTNDDDDDNDGHDNDDDDDNCAEPESHKSTPYYTPMEFMATPFNFPSPKLTDNAGCDRTTSSSSAANHCYCREDNNSKTHIGSAATNQSPRIIQASNKKYTTQTTTAAKHMEPTSPAIHRKFRRFSLYERRSCSPQHSIIKNAASMDCAMETDKENTKPKLRADHKDECNSGHNSPGVILDESGSPRILTNAEAAMLASGRLPYSPKLLNTINNLNLSSPLGVISSAGYKNGNYFKFPEIDQGLTLTSNHQSQADDIYDHIKIRPPSKKHNIGSLSPATLQQQPKSFTFDLNIEPKPKSGHDDGSTNINKQNTNTVGDKLKDTKRNRKNKNNLTIKIANSSLGSGQCTTNTTTTTNIITLSTSRPKTPTIKSTKEKALSLDSAAAISELRRGTVNSPAALYASFDEMDSHMPETKPPIHLEPLRASSLIKPRSTSMSQLSAATLHNRSNTNQSSYLVKNVRRRICTLNANEWQRQQNPFYESESLGSSKLLTKRVEDTKPVVYVQQEDAVINDKTALGTLAVPTMNSLNSIAAPTTAVRTSHKHNPLLHSSSTNLKTLPEFLTLVEFSTPTALTVEQQQRQQHPFKQKSMDFPISTAAAAAAATTSLPTGTRPPANASSSTNLLQRRGSNHSLTLNLHGSCGNLLGNCRTGLSISNYNIGSMKNSSNNLNSKSSDNLNTSNGQVKLNIINSATTTTNNTETTSSALSDANQVTKQSLFLRRSSNNTLTNLAATSCGNLNSFSSQSSLNVDKPLPIMTLQRPSLTNTPRRGLLERRGSNQNFTLNTSSSFGGLSTERSILQQSRIHSFGYSETESEVEDDLKNPAGCHQNQRKFYSSENLNRTKTQFADLNQTHKRNANQVCFGSVADLKASDRDNPTQPIAKEPTPRSLQNFDFQETTVCTCTGVRNIQTKPLSPQTTSEEFKVYLANIQMLQNASNALNHIDLIKLNYIFDNSYTTAEFKNLTEQTISLLNVPPKGELDSASSSSSPSLPTALLTHSNSGDCEIQERYLEVIRHILDNSQPDDEEQKRIFRNLHKEFWDLPLNHQEKPMVFGSQTKNRYKTILPNENSRVILEKESKLLQDMWLKVDANESDDVMMAEGDEHLPTMEEQPYINANYIKGPDYNSKCYIATQGPLPNTTYEFWLMIYQNTIKYMEICKGRENPSYRQGQVLQQYYQKIIMLTNFTENNRQKCTIYLPIELNELLVVVNREEVLAPTTIVRAFLEDYLKVDDSENDDQPNIAMRIFQVKITKELWSCMPRANSFFAIKNVGINKKRGFSTRKLIVLYCATATNTKQPLLLINRFYCYHYWYPDWPDHRSPQDINTLLDIALHVLNLGKCETEFDSFSSDKASPYAHIMTQSVNLYQQDIFNAVQPLPVIHCSAGIGRTGCLTAILNGIRQVRQSLAYSLTSMAAAATKRATLDPALSPVDFCLPRTFLEQYASANVLEEPLRLLQQQDMDCSFTRNTLLYLQYIIKMQQQQQSDAAEEEGDCASTTLPSLLDLPRMPNIFVDILGIVCNLRLQRGGMVQNSEQYELIHRAICLYLKRTFALKRF